MTLSRDKLRDLAMTFSKRQSFCLECGASAFRIGPELATLAGEAMVLVSCGGCGHVRLFSAAILGVAISAPNQHDPSGA